MNDEQRVQYFHHSSFIIHRSSFILHRSFIVDEVSMLRRLIRLSLPLVMVPLFITTVFPQGGQPPQPPPPINQSADPLLKTFRFRSIGPASVGGRIDDIAVSESDPSVIYVGYAVGGVFKSENNGTTFAPG